MIPEDGEDAVRRRQRRERLGRRMHIALIPPGHVVAAEENQVGPLRHEHIDRRHDRLVGDRLTAMQIREDADAESLQRIGQAGDW